MRLTRCFAPLLSALRSMITDLGVNASGVSGSYFDWVQADPSYWDKRPDSDGIESTSTQE